MDTIITSYLFQNKICPLPGLGTLHIATKSAQFHFINHEINAPQNNIIFTIAETDTAGLVDYISYKKKCSVIDAIDELGKYCNSLKQQCKDGATATIPMIGNIVVNNEGVINFSEQTLPLQYTLPVPAKQVVREGSVHTILVGDKETTNTKMAEYFVEDETPITKDYWWVWALVLFALAACMIIAYISQYLINSFFGNVSLVN
jgi:hypothetical protein